MELSKKDWKEIIEEAKLYDLQLPRNLEKIPEGKEVDWTGKEPFKPTYWNKKKEAKILEVTKVFSNPKGTVKVIIAGKKLRSMFGQDERVDGFSSLSIERYSSTKHDVFQKIKKGSWLITEKHHYRNYDVVAFMSNEQTISQVKKILEILDTMKILRGKYSQFNWKNQDEVKTYGTVSLQDVLQQKVIFDRTLRKLRWKERKEKWDLMNSVKQRLIFKTQGNSLIVKAKALDNRNYYLKCPLKEKEQKLGYKDLSIYTIDFWIPFIHPSQHQTKQGIIQQFLNLPKKLPRIKRMEMSVDNKKIVLTRKERRDGAIINYLNGKLVPSKEVRMRLQDYWIFNNALFSRTVKKTKGQTLSKEAQNLIENGLNGEMRDLEGDFPFHLNILYKKKKWYIECAGKEYYIKGGYNSLRKVKSAIQGDAHINTKKYGWDSRSTRVIKDRIGELIGDKEALEIILNVKKMGALIKAIGNNK